MAPAVPPPWSGALLPGAPLAAAGGPPLGHLLPLWSAVPFALLLLSIAVLPLAAARLWEPNRNKAVLAALLGAPVAAWVARLDPAAVGHAAHEYCAAVFATEAYRSRKCGLFGLPARPTRRGSSRRTRLGLLRREGPQP